MRRQRLALLMTVLGSVLAGCASGGGSRGSTADGPERARARLKEPVRNAAEGYIAATEDLARVLSGVTDTPGARQAMSRIEQLLANLGEHWRALDAAGGSARAEARYAYWARLDSADRALEAQVARIKGTPGVGSALSGLLDKVPRWR
jgi:hypothetical protein